MLIGLPSARAPVRRERDIRPDRWPFVPRVLVATANPDDLASLSFTLRGQSMAVTVAADGAEVLRRWAAERPDLILVDEELPRVGGIEVCRRVHRAARTPVIVIGDSLDDPRVVAAFRSGADDYITRTSGPRQITLRIAAVLRRYLSQPVEEETAFRAGEYLIDEETHQVRRDAMVVRLTPLEFRIFWILARNHRRVVSFRRIIEHAWGAEGGDARSLKTHVNHLRRKLDMEAGKAGYLSVVHGVGYVLGK